MRTSLSLMRIPAGGPQRLLRRIGPDLVFGRLWQESGLREAFQATLKTRRYEFDLERAI